MCRWLAYAGSPIYLESLLFKPENSLINQSLHARQSVATTNGDGFGVGWYSDKPEPGLFRDVLPAWNDDNLRSVSEQITSGLFFAHVRASTGTATARANCHPFRHGRWLFMHNGRVGGYMDIRRHLELAVAPRYYRHRVGTTDSEVVFYLALSYGLDRDPPTALARAIGTTVRIMEVEGVAEPFRMTAALTDGRTIYVVRYSSDHASPSLFHGDGHAAFPNLGEVGRRVDGMLIVSEPLDAVAEHWRAVPEASLLVAGDGQIEVTPLAPDVSASPV